MNCLETIFCCLGLVIVVGTLCSLLCSRCVFSFLSTNFQCLYCRQLHFCLFNAIQAADIVSSTEFYKRIVLSGGDQATLFEENSSQRRLAAQ